MVDLSGLHFDLKLEVILNILMVDLKLEVILNDLKCLQFLRGQPP